ncbi:hypothetical protein [Pseudomonas viridiflava]|uniref:hypothetical protein n=1 Tax=Pseudomonas viridiflava TaxID=33069 RepID=UPI001BCAFFA5|nr:hypothetical protein [Pseudomonas viridiflava]QVI88017.1 hypothetical protein KHW14_11985 [Pseudomonas viridiflava]
MKAQSNQTSVKPKPVKLADGRHRCLLDTCRKAFTPKRSDQCYCKTDKRDCKLLSHKASKAATTTKRKVYTVPADAHQRYRILDAVRAAGTVQALKTWVGDVDEAAATINILTMTNTANLKNGKNTFHTCHVDAVKHSHRMGLLSSQNLFVGLGTRNRAAKAFSSGMGQSISRLDLKAKWCVDASMSNADVWTMIEEFVGIETLTEACRKAGLKPSAKAQAIANLEQVVDLNNPEHAPFVKVLNNPKSTALELQMAVAEIQGKRVFNMKLKATTEQEILFAEIRRHSAFRPELDFLLTPINKMYTSFISEDDKAHQHLIGVLSEDHLQTLFSLLQGHDADHMVDEVEELMFGFNFASRKIIDDKAVSAARQASMDAHNAYYALSREERAEVDLQRREELDLAEGRIYEEGDDVFRVYSHTHLDLSNIPGWAPF